MSVICARPSRERGDSQEGGNRRCLPSCAPARRQRTFRSLLKRRLYIIGIGEEKTLEISTQYDIMKKVETISNGRIRVGPGTLYTLLRKFQQAGLIKETSVEGRKISYIITEDGINILKEEYNRLLLMVNDGKDFLNR